MDKKNITPEQNQPINRITNGQLPAELAELSEEILQDEAYEPAIVLAGCAHKGELCYGSFCSYDGDDTE